MKYIILTILICFSTAADAQIKKYFKFATFYGAVNGGTSISDVDVYSVTNGLQTSVVQTPYDYNIALGVRKIARFGYENRSTFYDGTEDSWSDGASIGKVSGLEFLFELDYKRLQDLHKSKQIIESQSCEIQKLEKQINIYIYHFPNFKRTRF